MASYHLSVKTVKRSAGRSATAAAAYRSGESIACEREGRVHDYTAKRGIAETFILTPEDAPTWAQDRAALWNAAEERETRRNSVTAREWELALPAEISDEDRSLIVRDFAQALVDRYGVAADVAIHAPHREGDQRNHHAHILTTTRMMTAEGLTDKTRVLDAAKTGGVEIEQMRGVWAEMQNQALERAGRAQGLEASDIARVDHRSLEAQREAALDRGDALSAEELDRAPEVKLGPAANAMERREMREAEAGGREYQPVTERGRAVHAARQARVMFREMRERLELARETYGLAREEGQGRVSAGLAALRAAAGKEAQQRSPEQIRERLEQIVVRDREGLEVDVPEQPGADRMRERLAEVLDRGRSSGLGSEGRGVDSEDGVAQERRRPTMREQRANVRGRDTDPDLQKKGKEQEMEDRKEQSRQRDRGIDDDYGL
jgi:MobA/MobL family